MKIKKVIKSLTAAGFIFSLIISLNNCSENSSNNKKQVTDTVKVTQKEKLLTDNDLKGMQTSELRIKRNEIFAKHGYIFQNSELKKYFSKFDWYSQKYKNVDNLLTDDDKKNIELIKKYENLLKSKKHDFDNFLKLFDKIKDRTFEINSDFYKKYKTNGINNKYLSKFFGTDTAEFGKDCEFIEYTAICRFNIPESKNIGLFTTSFICPIPAVYDETQFWIFDPYGNLIDNYDIAYTRGGGGEMKTAVSVFKNNEFIKTITTKNDDRINGGVNT